MLVNGYEVGPWEDLRGAGLREADLMRADLRGADLQGADLRRADLRDANLRGANLRGADLQGADLRRADLQGADLRRADLRDTNLRGANLQNADLGGAYLAWANLEGADLRGADLRGADLHGVNLQGVNLTDALLPDFQIPAKGVEITGYKKLCDGSIAVLLIPADAMRTASLIGNKCRASRAIVIDGSGARGVTRGGVSYMTGAEVYPDSYDADIREECTHGIHFFMTRKEAEAYDRP